MLIDKSEILGLAEELYPLQVKWRRRFHRLPELSNREFETTRFIKQELKRRGIKVIPLKLKTGAAGIINAKKGGAVAIRTDIDALPILEKTGLSYRSKNAGVMHACGHDVHCAVVLGAAVILEKLKARIPGAVKIIFQPSEEMPPGGAGQMIRAGILDNPRVQMIYGLHTDPRIVTGKIGLRDGPIMASVTDFDITVIGRGGHAARPHSAVDAIAVAAEMIESMQKIVSREIDPMNPAVITFGSIAGGTARNVIAESVILRGTARTLSQETQKRIPHLIKRTLAGICRARGADYKLDFIASYPVLANHREANVLLAGSYADLFGKNKIELTPQGMGGEDFAFYVKKTPGAMFRLGIRNDKIGANKPWHSSDFMVDERSIYYGTALLVSAVFKFFESRHNK
jgi:amidohydrolase